MSSDLDLHDCATGNRLAMFELERMRAALRFYKDEAEALHRYVTTGNMIAAVASIHVLSLDGGNRAATALGEQL